MTEKSTLIKVVPRRFVPDSEITLISGLDYETTFVPIEPESVYQNDVSLSFSWDSSTNTLSFTADSAIDDNIFADYPLRFSTTKTVYTYDDPIAETGGIVEYSPRISKNPEFKQSVKNQVAGVLSFSKSSVQIVNHDSGLNQYLSRYDNYKNKPFKAYAKVGDTYLYLSEGTIDTIKAGRIITLSVKPISRVLKQDATFGNSQKFYEFNSTDYPNADYTSFGSPIIHHTGAISKNVGYTELITPPTGYNLWLDTNDMHKANKIDQNGYWLLGMVENPFPITGILFDVTSHSNFARTYGGSTVNVQKFTVPAAYRKFIIPGAWVGASTSALPTFAGVPKPIYEMDYDTGECIMEYGGSYYLSLALPTAYCVTKLTGTDTTSGTPVLLDPTTMGTTLEPVYEVAENGDTLVKAKYSTYPNAWAGTLDLYFILMESPSIQQNDYAQKIVESVGLTIDSSQFSQAGTDAPNDLLLNINDGKKLDKLDKVLQKVAYSNNGLIFVNDQTNEIGYKILKSNMGTPDWTVTETDILEPELKPEIDYNDVYHRVRAQNEFITDVSQWISGTNLTESSTLSKFLNSEEKTLDFEHTLEDATSAITDKLNIVKNPNFFWSFSLSSDNYYLMQVGDIVRMQDLGDKLIGNQSQIDVIIVDIAKSADTIKVTGYEFSEIP